MATFISLINWTEQGIRAYKDTPKRAEAFRQAVESRGGKLTSIYWCVGPYDIVSTIEAPDIETVTALLLQTGALGNVRSTTLQAFDLDQISAIIAKT